MGAGKPRMDFFLEFSCCGVALSAALCIGVLGGVSSNEIAAPSDARSCHEERALTGDGADLVTSEKMEVTLALFSISTLNPPTLFGSSTKCASLLADLLFS